MNPHQMSLQIKKKIRDVVWPTGSGDPVFGTQVERVQVHSGAPSEEDFPKFYPCCLIVMGDGEPDEDEPSLIEHTFRLVTGVMATGHPMGEHALIGGPNADLGTSANRGIGEVAARVRAAVEDLTGADGAKIQLVSTSIATPFLAGRMRHVVFDEHTVTALCTSDLHYSAPQQLRNVADTWLWEGPHCSDRFDFVQYRMYSRSGSDPTGEPGEVGSTLIYTGAPATHARAPAAATTYTVFADYSVRQTDQGLPASTIDGSSSPVVGSYSVQA